MRISSSTLPSRRPAGLKVPTVAGGMAQAACRATHPRSCAAGARARSTRLPRFVDDVAVGDLSETHKGIPAMLPQHLSHHLPKHPSFVRLTRRATQRPHSFCPDMSCHRRSFADAICQSVLSRSHVSFSQNSSRTLVNTDSAVLRRAPPSRKLLSARVFRISQN